MLYDFASAQAITGVVFEGVKKMSPGIDYGLKLEWGVVAMQVEDQNRVLNKRCVEIQKELREAGFECCMLKGQGNGILYPNPYSRMSGDIDMWVRPVDVKKRKDTRSEVLRFVKEHQKMVDEVRYYHIEYTDKEIPVELHFMPGIMNNPLYNHRLQQWYRSSMDEQCNHEVSLPDGAGDVAVPTREFNIVFQLAHMMHHFFDEGVGLRQMMDYYYVLMSSTSVATRQCVNEFPLHSLLHRLGLWKFAGAVMFVMKEVFQLEEKYMIAPVDGRRGETLMEEILKGGNFGQYSGLTQHGMALKYFLKIRRNMRFVTQYPAEALCEPIFRTWHFFWRLAHKN